MYNIGDLVEIRCGDDTDFMSYYSETRAVVVENACENGYWIKRLYAETWERCDDEEKWFRNDDLETCVPAERIRLVEKSKRKDKKLKSIKEYGVVSFMRRINEKI
jgi:hypothetical protein